MKNYRRKSKLFKRHLQKSGACYPNIMMMNLSGEGSAAGKLTSFDSSSSGSIDTNLIIGTRIYCSQCMLERMELIDRNGITHSGFELYRKAQVCEECKRGEKEGFLEFFPIYKGEQILEVTNKMAKENSKHNQKLKEELQKKAESKQGQDKKSKEIYINKYSGNGRYPLHESVIIGTLPTFVTIPDNYIGNGDITPSYKHCLDPETGTIYFPNGTIDTVTPLPYIFDSKEEFSKYLKLAFSETYDSLYLKVDAIYRKYVNVEEYYYPILVGDTIWSYFQDRFGYTHYLIFTGDNGSGKNSALLVFKYLGYRVFYVVSANAANYYTAYGSQEEGQVSIAEDEADDIGEDKAKRDILKSGYQSGGSVPKIELEGGRSQDNWLVYGMKWLAMEELKVDKNTKGILHRSIEMGFLAGDVPYNIKDVIRSGDDPEYKPLLDEIMHVRKLLICFRLLQHKVPIPMIKLNVKGRTAELTSPLIRLFQNSPLAREKIFESFSEFMKGRRQTILNSFEAKLRESIQSLINARAERSLEPTEEDKELGASTFTNESIKQKLIDDTEAQPDLEKKNAYYSNEIGWFNQSKITIVLKSKFKPKFIPAKRINGKLHRCVEFKQEYLNRLKDSYHVPDKIQILTVTPVTAVTPLGRIPHTSTSGIGDLNTQNDIKITKTELKVYDNSKSKDNDQASKDNENSHILPDAVTGVTSVTAVTCPKCGEPLDAKPYWANMHIRLCEGKRLD